MTETVASDRPPVAKPVSRPRSRKLATVSASALAQHLDCSRIHIGKLEAEGVIQQQGDGFPLDQSRVAYLRYLLTDRPDRWHHVDASIGHGGALQSRPGGQAEHRRGGNADQARDSGSMQQGSRRSQRAAA